MANQLDETEFEIFFPTVLSGVPPEPRVWMCARVNVIRIFDGTEGAYWVASRAQKSENYPLFLSTDQWPIG